MAKLDKKLNGIIALHNFMESTGIKKSGVYQDFRASVTVTGSPALSTVTGVRITNSGDGGGKIALEENDELYSEKYHLDFNPTWQEYIFEKSRGALVIRGRSEKMGEYEFVIVPIPDSK